MTTYIIRRLLLMIPTLVGITFVVFMIVACSPGGIGAGLLVQSGGSLSSNTDVARKQAYIEDRYGLDDPPLVQYVKWLGRVSPVKFGRRAQHDGRELIYAPDEVAEPTGWRWYAEGLPRAERRAESFTREGLSALVGVALSEEPTAEEKQTLYRRAKARYDEARFRYIADRAAVEEVFKQAATGLRAERIRLREQIRERNEGGSSSTGSASAGGAASLEARLAELVAQEQRFATLARRDGKIDRRAIERMEPTAELPGHDRLVEAGRAAVASYGRAVNEREVLLAAFDVGPYERAGIGLVGGVSVAGPDFGRSFTSDRPSLTLILDRMPTTLLLNSVAIPLIYLIAVPTGMLAAARRGSAFDVASGAAFVALWSIPTVWAGTLGIGFLANSEYMQWFPVTGLHSSGSDDFTMLPYTDGGGVWHAGYLLDTLWHMALPVACLTYTGFAVLSKQTRASMLDNFSSDYVRTARAKGVSSFGVVFRHVFRNSLLPLITMFVGIFPAMLSGSLVVEIIFTIDGMGKLAYDAINQRDRELLLANTLMIGVVNLLALLAADILYALADPRISYK